MGHEGHGRGDGEEALRRGVPRIRPQEGSVRLLKGEKQTIDRHTHKERQEEGEERESARAVGRIKAPGSARCVSKFYQSNLALPSLRLLSIFFCSSPFSPPVATSYPCKSGDT